MFANVQLTSLFRASINDNTKKFNKVRYVIKVDVAKFSLGVIS
jgi:hypothetical protein